MEDGNSLDSFLFFPPSPHTDNERGDVGEADYSSFLFPFFFFFPVLSTSILCAPCFINFLPTRRLP